MMMMMTHQLKYIIERRCYDYLCCSQTLRHGDLLHSVTPFMYVVVFVGESVFTTKHMLPY